MTSDRSARPSQRDVARLAGVSRTTVSFVVNEVTDVAIPEATRAKVWAAVAQLGFRPNELARGLRSRRSGVLGLVTDAIATTPYAVGIISGAQEAATRHGRTLLIVDTDGVGESMLDTAATMIRWQAEGLLLATDHHRELTLDGDLGGLPPTVLVNCADAQRRLPAVVPDERQGGRLATATLIEAGHRRVGLVNGPPDYPASAGRLAGWRDAHAAAGLTVDERLVRVGDWWQESGYARAADLLDLPDPPTALFCANDWMAMGAYDLLRERGLRVPDDVAVIGFDNREEIAAHLRPALSTVALPYREMGRYAVDRLVAGDPAPGVTALACPLVPRASV
ncbi:LacI family DNA-binding transcriptional regulator [Micromonospora endolithica]|uniref:LacI family DNA-binding transcriptional regulator n=1 Tax=Micromonospora endolithica TaxID=230091 RepID=A0A3A9ZMJ3_9ACTN|nr:LacI family DNA-binding transcriptional regulator [Micromonospora endolithica]RKN48557.1 LacI family DNA-binding transcriptional regulator [Micromonospora endolithica]TWJ22120.1 LacI family transcriptional regulator [Micromonospora endolithica]